MWGGEEALIPYWKYALSGPGEAVHWRYQETTWGIWLRGSWLSLGNADHSALWTLGVRAATCMRKMMEKLTARENAGALETSPAERTWSWRRCLCCGNLIGRSWTRKENSSLFMPTQCFLLTKLKFIPGSRRSFLHGPVSALQSKWWTVTLELGDNTLITGIPCDPIIPLMVINPMKI